MKNWLLLLILTLSTAVMADITDCKPPIHKQPLTYQPTANTPVHFANIILELPKPDSLGFFNQDLIIKYGQKSISLSYITEQLMENQAADYDPVAAYKEALGLTPKTGRYNAEIKAITSHLRLCDNELILYQTKNIDYEMIRTKQHTHFSDQQTIDTFLLGRFKDVYVIRFKGFSSDEIDQTLATIHSNKKRDK